MAKRLPRRAGHLFDVRIPMLFLQGDRDKLADLNPLRPIVKRLGTRAELKVFPEADHSFHVPLRVGRPDCRAGWLADVVAQWMRAVSER